MRIEAGEFALYTGDLPKRPGWHRVIIEHLPTGYRKMDGAEPVRTDVELRNLLTEILQKVTAVPVRENLDSWPKQVQKQYPKMIEKEEMLYDSAKISLAVLIPA